MITPEKIRKAMGFQVKNISKHVFPQDRPNATDSSLTDFIVVSLPYSESRKEISREDWWLDITVVYEIYVADKKSAGNAKRLDDDRMEELRLGVYGTFPLVDEELGIQIDEPRTVIPSSSDGNGYQFTRIQAKMTTMV
jgi:hypothetical protein